MIAHQIFPPAYYALVFALARKAVEMIVCASPFIKPEYTFVNKKRQGQETPIFSNSIPSAKVQVELIIKLGIAE